MKLPTIRVTMSSQQPHQPQTNTTDVCTCVRACCFGIFHQEVPGARYHILEPYSRFGDKLLGIIALFVPQTVWLVFGIFVRRFSYLFAVFQISNLFAVIPKLKNHPQSEYTHFVTCNSFEHTTHNAIPAYTCCESVKFFNPHHTL